MGGRIVRDKLWFYGGYAKQTKSDGTLGFAADAGPDGRYLTGDEPQAYFESSLYQYSLKLSYQMSRNNRFVYAWQRGVKAQPQNGGDSLQAPRGDARLQESDRHSEGRVAEHGDPSPAAERDGRIRRVRDRLRRRPLLRAGSTRRAGKDLETALITGSHVQHQGKTRDRYQAEASASFFPGRSFAGQHDFKTGVSIYWDRTSDVWLNNVAGNYVLITDRINGVSGTPLRIRAYNTPVAPKDNEDIYAWYFKDSWRANRQADVESGCALGVSAFVSAGAGLSTALAISRRCSRPSTFDTLDVQTFNRVVPRVGVAYDLGGKSVIKATWGLYNYILGDTYADVFAATATANAVFLWHDLNNDKLWQPGESDLRLNEQPGLRQHHSVLKCRAQPGTETTGHVGEHRELRARAGSEPWVPRDVHQQDRPRAVSRTSIRGGPSRRTTFPSRGAIRVLTECSVTATTQAESRCSTMRPHTGAQPS